MKIKAIDKILKIIEVCADDQQFALDEFTPYIEVCNIVTDFEFYDIQPTFEQKKFCADTLELICDGLGLDYYKVLMTAIEQTEDHPQC
jgi:hypothetical protein